MAEGATIGALRFVLGADTAQLEAATGKASAAMRAAARAGEVAGQQITAAFTRVGGMLVGALAVERLVQFGQQALEAGASIRRFADQAGLTTTQFQELQFALRETGVTGEQLAVAFATFSRNLSDLHRGTGPLLDFLRQSAPQFVSQFQRVTDVNQAFDLLANVLSRARNSHDALRLAQAAGGEQMGRVAMEAARLGPAFEQARRAAHEAGRVLSEEQVEQLRKARQAWTDFGDWVTIQTGRILASIQSIGREPAPDIAHIVASIARLQGIISRLTEGSAMWRVRVAELRAEQEKLNEAIGRGIALSTAVTPAPPDDGWTARQNAIKAAQDQLTLFMARMNQLPSQANFVSTAFAEAWRRMDAAMAASGQSEAARAAARIQLIQQEAAARTSALGNAMLVQEQLALREEELRLRRSQGIITETEYQRALNLARSEYQMAQLMEMQNLGVTLSIQEQYALSIQRVDNALQRGAISAEAAGRAHRAAALTAQAAWLGALGQVAGALAQAFPKQKAFAVAAAIINVAEGITKAMTLPFPLNWAQAAAVAASGLAQIQAIKSANPSGSGGSVPAVGGGASQGTTAPVEATGASAGQSLTINLPAGRYSHEEVMQIIEGINDRVQNGATLISTKVAA